MAKGNKPTKDDKATMKKKKPKVGEINAGHSRTASFSITS
jgi:hypothetical protein